eukprot:1276730-Rhodomonas_salina.3
MGVWSGMGVWFRGSGARRLVPDLDMAERFGWQERTETKQPSVARTTNPVNTYANAWVGTGGGES